MTAVGRRADHRDKNGTSAAEIAAEQLANFTYIHSRTHRLTDGQTETAGRTARDAAGSQRAQACVADSCSHGMNTPVVTTRTPGH